MKYTDFLTSNIHVELIRVLAENRCFFKSRLAKTVISNASNRHVVHDKEYTKPQAQFLLLISIAIYNSLYLMLAFVVHIIVMLDEVIIKLFGCGQRL